MAKQFLITGLGSISQRHRSNLKQLFPDCKIYAISASKQLKDKNIENIDVLCLEKDKITHTYFDMVFICSPSSFHLEDLIEFKSKSNNIFIEKPLFTDEQLTNPMINNIDKLEKNIFVGYCLRFNDSLIFFKKLLQNKIIGRIHNIQITAGHDVREWRPNKRIIDTVSVSSKLGGGALLELSHELDYLNWIFGEVFINSAVIKTLPSITAEVESLANIFGTCLDGCSFNVNLDFISPFPKRFCLVYGEKGDLKWDYIKNEVTLFSKDGVKVLYNSKFDVNKMYLNQMKSMFNLKNEKHYEGASWSDGVKVIQQISNIRSINL